MFRTVDVEFDVQISFEAADQIVHSPIIEANVAGTLENKDGSLLDGEGGART